MPADVGSQVEGAEARPVVVARHALTQGDAPADAVLVGFEPGTGEPQVTAGEAPAGPDEVAVDAVAGLDVGDQAELGGQTFTVSGLTEHRTLFAGMPLVFMEIDAAQELVYRGQDLATAVLVDGEPTSVPDGYEVLSNEAVAEDAMRPLEKSVSSVNIIRVLLWFVAAMIIGTMVYLSALERRRDVAVLKAIGGSTSRLGASIALQGALIALTAALLAAVLQRFLTPVFPLAVSVPAQAFVQVPVIAVVIALLAGIVGLRKAVRVDPALAFSGPGA
jgi:putative ABC transport system permease protein